MASDNTSEIQDLRDQVSSLTEHLLELKSLQAPPPALPQTDGWAAVIDAIGRLFEHPLAAAVIGSFAILVLVPFAKNWLHNNVNGFGVRKGDGKKITLSDVQKTQIRIMKENRNLIYKIARRVGVKENDL